ncbi:hypothetical protein DL766_010402 [Monosporascus sp. MC13-8B]|uniref:Carrier domain-containing protein n=1 Tax=Monosporascus cannonballus TaxID=155416 RepID=A0ABY0HD40_9PEZI|nr:hypothetical protein DL762_002956 [Monosporascus cannonballus]RYO96607.1 hypothetical protein DL763_003093 [Monosporascus cannonballus]RYP02365.1 hypothetical protein DL766_010402 [Monosporascus sp. MC13-8B]
MGSLSLPSTLPSNDATPKSPASYIPVAICGMATRLPGGISSAEQLWDFLLNKGDACARIPFQRYVTHGVQGNASGPTLVGAGATADTHAHVAQSSASPETPNWKTHSYMLNHVDIGAFDAGLFSMTQAELGIMDPQQRLLLELTRECFETAGETQWRGKDVGVYIGSLGEDWNDVQYHDRYDQHMYKVTGTGDFALSNRISYEYDLKGPSLVVRTACAASLHALDLACQALQTSQMTSALVGGVNLIMNPAKTEAMVHFGVLSKGASSKSFDADADGYARAEAVNMVYVKRLDDALRDGNPIRAVIRATASNSDGKTSGLTKPSGEAHEALIRSAYRAAGLEGEMGKTGFFECHATGTASGDPEEVGAVARTFGDQGGMYIGSVKPNMGHSEGASGLTSLIKCVMALENKVIPPNIKFNKPNPNIPFKQSGLRVPTDAVSWPQDRHERASINSFGVGGANAHVIIDSAASFGISTHCKGNVAATTGDRLLVFTANEAESARRGAQECSRFLANHPAQLDDTAYTLGLRREHFPYRSFAVVREKDASDVTFSTPVRMSAAPCSVIFVFTGQGSQWPSMGSALLSDHSTAMQDLLLMEKALATLGRDIAPTWALSEQLMLPKETSQVYKAELSQPLCTAVQVMVVNHLRRWGVQCAAVIGHSSGEIGAAYACGAITMDEAIICAYLRGRAMNTRKSMMPVRAGGMAAVGLAASDAQKYLVDGVVVGCENSPSSTTLSGDEEKLTGVLEAIKQDRPEVFSKRLAVDMAYHSHHMKEIGEEYERALAPHIASKTPLVPFLSTVTNEVIKGDGALSAAYWRSNLESPVLFNTGVKALLKLQEANNSILVEIGPHSALSRPLRQILGDVGSLSSSYLPTLVRYENESKALLNTVGQLFCKGLAPRFDVINPTGRVVTTLPTYPWNHATSYWYESRVSREYRGRRFPHHPVLGSRVVEASQVEPIWRNLLRLDSIGWCRDHKIGNDVVFPGTGYLAMASEAMRQLTNTQDVAFRQVVIAAALILSETDATETILSMRPRKLTNTLNSAWYEFSISSYDKTSQLWTRHCFGLVRAGTGKSKDDESLGGTEPGETSMVRVAHLPREISPAYWYKAMRSVGQTYGPQFQRLSRISTHLMESTAVADLQTEDDEGGRNEAGYRDFHPATSDACMQLFSAATARGQARSLQVKAVPTYIAEAYFSSAGCGTITVKAATDDTIPGGPITGTCVGVDATNRVVLRLKGVKLTPLDEDDDSAEDQHGPDSKDPHAGARVLWRPDFDFLDARQLIHSSRDKALIRKEAYCRLQKLLLLCCVAARDEYGNFQASKPYLAKFQEWIVQQVAKVGDSDDGGNNSAEVYPLVSRAEAHELLQLSTEKRSARIEELVKSVLETEYAAVGKLIHRVHRGLGDILSGRSDGLEILRQKEENSNNNEDNNGDPLAGIYSIGNQEWDYAPFLRLLGHRTPHLRILEIGAGTGGTTDLILRQLEGKDAFYSYVYTDVSAGFFTAAKRRFPHHRYPRMRFQTLDITSDPVAQGFEPNSFDLIVAANVLHATPQLGRSLAHVRKILRPDGRLLLQEMYMTVKWVNFIMGVLPGWWLGGHEDQRPMEPYVSPARWVEELRAAGFSSSDSDLDINNKSTQGVACIMDMDEEPFQANVTIIAAPSTTPHAVEHSPKSPVSLLCRWPDGEAATRASKSLQSIGIEVETIGLSDTPRGETVISILDLEEERTAFLRDDMQADEYDKLRDFVSKKVTPAPAGSLLWLTKPSQMHCADPQYAGVVGLLRVVRNETGLPLCTLELDDGDGDEVALWRAVAGVYHKILRTRHMQPQDEMADPDCEFAYRQGAVYIPRFHWVSVEDELVAAEQTRRGVEQQTTFKTLGIRERGSLNSLGWVEKLLPPVDALEGDEVAINIRAIGLSSKDTHTALGIIASPQGAEADFGVECSGVIRSVGPDAANIFSIGDRVMAMSYNSYATTMVTTATSCVRIPDDQSFEEAATMPGVYPTAIHGLVNLARLEKGQTVLIHSACEAVGLAAMYVCRNVLGIGVQDIYTTVDSPDKVQFLIDTFGLPASHIFHSHDASFLPGIMRQTQNHGVDVVLNSLPGELLHASWSCVAEFGTMIEMGKRDFIGQGQLDMAPFEGNRAFLGLDLLPVIRNRPRRFRQLLSEQTMDYYSKGLVPPIRPMHVFEAIDVESAISTLQEGQHIGQVVVKIPEDTSGLAIPSAAVATRTRRKEKLKEDRPSLFRADVAYFLVGGLGGLGRSIALWMAQHGARNFIFLSRSGEKGQGVAALIRALEGAGCIVDVVAGSVTQLEDVCRAVRQARKPVAGVIQLSMVLRDGLFADMPYDDWAAVTAPKMKGTWNLHHVLLSAKQPLEFFVLFSSFAGVVGSRGQANYAAASVFLDAFAQFRQGLGLPAAVLDVGAVADVGFVAEQPDLVNFFRTSSHHILREQDVLDAVELAVRKSVTHQQELEKKGPRHLNGTAVAKVEDQVFVSETQLVMAMRSSIPLSSPRNRNVWKRDARLSMYRNLEAAAEARRNGGDDDEASSTSGAGQAATNQAEGDDDAIRRLLTTMETNPSGLTMDESIIEQLARRIAVVFFSLMGKANVEEELNINAELVSLGFDSLIIIEMRNWLRQRLMLNISVMEIMRSGNLMGLARLAAHKWAAASANSGR